MKIVSLVCGLFLASIAVTSFAADKAPAPEQQVQASQPAKQLEVKDEWFTPVQLNINGLKVWGFIYTGPGQFIVQDQRWVPAPAKVQKPKDPLEELKVKPEAKKPEAKSESK